MGVDMAGVNLATGTVLGVNGAARAVSGDLTITGVTDFQDNDGGADLAHTITIAGTLGGTGAISANDLSYLNFTKVAPGSSIGTLEFGGSYEVPVGLEYQLEISGPGVNDLVSIDGNLTFAGGNDDQTLVITLLGGYAPSAVDFTFIDYTGSGPVPGATPSWNVVAGAIQTNVAWTDGGAAGVWGDVDNWDLGIVTPGAVTYEAGIVKVEVSAANLAPQSDSVVTIDGDGAGFTVDGPVGSTTIAGLILGGTGAADSLDVSVDGLSITGPTLTLTDTVTVSGTGVLTLGTAVAGTGTGGVQIDAGGQVNLPETATLASTLAVTMNGGTLHSTGNNTLATKFNVDGVNDGTVDVDGGVILSLDPSNGTAWAGTLNKTGAGELALVGASPFQLLGDLTVTGGSATSVDGIVVDGATLTVTPTGLIPGATDLTATGGGTVSIADTASLDISGNLTLDNGVLQATASTTVNRAIHLGAAGGTFEAVGAGTTLTLDEPINGEISTITKTGLGTLDVGGAGLLSNALNIDAGKFTTAGYQLAQPGGAINIAAGATLQASGVVTRNITGAVTGTLESTGDMVVGTSSTDFAFGGLVKLGAGNTVVLLDQDSASVVRADLAVGSRLTSGGKIEFTPHAGGAPAPGDPGLLIMTGGVEIGGEAIFGAPDPDGPGPLTSKVTYLGSFTSATLTTTQIFRGNVFTFGVSLDPQGLYAPGFSAGVTKGSGTFHVNDGTQYDIGIEGTEQHPNEEYDQVLYGDTSSMFGDTPGFIHVHDDPNILISLDGGYTPVDGDAFYPYRTDVVTSAVGSPTYPGEFTGNGELLIDTPGAFDLDDFNNGSLPALGGTLEWGLDVVLGEGGYVKLFVYDTAGGGNDSQITITPGVDLRPLGAILLGANINNLAVEISKTGVDAADYTTTVTGKVTASASLNSGHFDGGNQSVAGTVGIIADVIGNDQTGKVNVHNDSNAAGDPDSFFDVFFNVQGPAYGSELIVGIVPDGDGYAGINSRSNESGNPGTNMVLLGGSNIFSAEEVITTTWRLPVPGDLNERGFQVPFTSDIVDLTGIDGDVFVLQLTYDDSALTFDESLIHVIRNDLVDGYWVNAGDTDAFDVFLGSYNAFVDANDDPGPYDPADFLGAWGVDTTGNEAWVITDHNSEFSTPEPGTIALLSMGAVGMLMRRRRRRA